MSMLPAYRVDLESNLDDVQCLKILTEIKSMKGVLSAGFNKHAQAIFVTHANQNGNLARDITKIQGVKKIGHAL